MPLWHVPMTGWRSSLHLMHYSDHLKYKNRVPTPNITG
jgi:hypothetical protein